MPVDPNALKSEPQVAFPSTAGQQTAPTTGEAVDSNDSILKKWLEIWNDTREKTFRPDGEGGGSWWEDDEEYPETVRTGGGGGVKPASSSRKPAIKPPFEMPDYPDVEGGPESYYRSQGNVWENTWLAAKDKYGEMIDIGMSVKGETPAETARRRRQAPPDPQALKKVAGAFGEAAKFAFVGMSNALKRAIGWTVEMNAWAPAEKALASGLDTPFAYNLLIEGEYAEAMRRQSMQTAGPGTRPKETESTKAAYEKAKRLQEEYNTAYQEKLKTGLSKERAAREAAMDVTKRQVELEHTAIGSPKPDIGAPSTRDNPFGITQEARDSWAEAAGFRYTHIADPEKARQYEQLRLAGVPAKEAGDQTEDPVVEATWQLILDPNWAIPLDNLVVGAGWEIVKGTGKGLLSVASKTPILKGGIEWATEITATTAANYAARYADDALRQIKRYADETGQIISPEFVETILRNPPEDFLRTLTAYDHRALRGAYDQVDAIVSAVKKGMDTKELTEALELAIKETPGADTRVLQEAVNDKAWGGALKRAAGDAYIAGKEVYYAAHPFAEKMGKSNWFKRVLTNVKGVMVDTWLGVRPSWNVFNATDNMVKLLLDGVNPFQSIPSLLKRCALYSPDFAKTADAALGELKGMHFWNMSTKNNQRYVELLHELYKKQAIGSFGQTALSAEGGGSLLRKAPVIGDIIEWNTSLGGRIEAAAHARAFTTFFLKELDEGWGALVKREVAATVGGSAVKVSDEVAAPIVAKLRTMRNPTVEGVRNIIDSSIMRPNGNVVSPTMGAEFGRTLTNLDTGVANDVEKAINRLTNLGSYGPQPVARDVDRIFSKAEAQVNAAYKEKVESGIRAFDDTLPVYPKDADEMYTTLVPKGTDATLPELYQAIDDMPMIAHRANLESTRMSNEHWKHMAELRRQKATAAVKAKAQDDFLLRERADWWGKYNQMQEDIALRIMDEIDTRLSLQGIGEKFPRTQMRKYLDAGKAITDAQQAKYTKWRSTMIELNSGSLLKAERDALMDLSRKETDELWNAVYPKAKADVHDSLVAIREWFETTVMKDSTDPSMVELAKNAGWWRVGQQVDDITVEARKFADAQLQDLQAWKKVVMEKRSTPYEEIPMADAEREALRLYRDQMMEDVHALVSSAESSAIKQVGELLFDYETTQNWMSLLGAVFPFVRFPAKNLPLWAGKFAEIPHLAGAIYNVRALQAAINKDLPSRHRYSIKLNPKFLDPLMSAIGLDNFELRVNPWSFISIFQQFPGATAFSARKLEEMMLDSGDEDTKQGLRVFSTLAGEFGFGMWPYLEWIAGSFGWLGQDWYPRDALGTWAPVTDFVVKEAFGYDKNFSIDRFMRANATDWWNTLFGGTELDWNQLNPDLFQEWAKGKEIEGIIMAMPEPAAAALAAITPTQAYAVVKAMPAAQREAMLPRVMEVFKMPPQQLAQAIAALTPEEQALFLVQMDIVAMRNVVRKRFVTGIIGNVAGLYIDPMRKSEIEATQMRADRRAEAQKLAPGAERREMMSQWYEEHPKYSMISNWRFDEHPWAETAAGEEIEKWDATLNQYKTKYYEFSRGLTEKEDALIAETYAKYPGDILRLKALKASFREQRAAYVEAMNAECKATLEAKLHEYEMTYPHDKAGIEKLRKGWDTAVYVGVQLSEEERQQLATFEEVSPDDEEGYNTLFQKLYDQAAKRTPATQMRHIPGLDEGLAINLEFSPAPGGNYSEEELQEFLVGDVLQELYDGGPQKEDYPGDYDMWWEKHNEYLEGLTDAAMKTDLAKKQVALVAAQLSSGELVSQQTSINFVNPTPGQWNPGYGEYALGTEEEYLNYLREFPEKYVSQLTFKLLEEGSLVKYSPSKKTVYAAPQRYQIDHEMAHAILTLSGKDKEIESFLGGLSDEEKAALANISRVSFKGGPTEAQLDTGYTYPGDVEFAAQTAAAYKSNSGRLKKEFPKVYAALKEAYDGVEYSSTGTPVVSGPQSQAEKIVASWYELEDLQRMWRKDHTVWEALEYVYDNHIVSEADDEYFGEITALQDADYDLYALRKEDLDMRYGQQEAGELIKYIMQDYPGKWTVRELQIALQDVVMPSYFERLTLRASGEKGVDSNIWLMYNKMSADDKLVAREQLGPLFSDSFLKGNTKDISVTLRGQWLNALSTSVGEPMDWHSLPGIDMAPSKEAVDFGLPNVGQRDEAEFMQARLVNQQYWQAKVAGDDATVEKLEADPLRQKWFGLSSASSYFWNLYYTQLPPGPFAKELKEGGFLKLLLDKPVREVAATNSDYDRATRAIEEFLEKQQGVMKALDLRPEEYDEVRRMTTEYYAIPQEDKNSRKAYLKANPLLKKYFDAEAGVADAMGEIQLPEKKAATTTKAKTGTTARRASGRGGGGSSGGGGVTNPEDVWTSFRTTVGGSYVAVLRMLSSYWETGMMTPTASAYLQKLYAQTGEGLSFEEWLDALREGWAGQKTPSVRVPSVPKASAGYSSYSSGKGTSGIRR